MAAEHICLSCRYAVTGSCKYIGVTTTNPHGFNEPVTWCDSYEEKSKEKSEAKDSKENKGGETS